MAARVAAQGARKRPRKEKEPPRLPPELQRALDGFTPVFGSAKDASIVDRVRQLRALLAKPTERDTRYLERSLLEDITARNMDF
jgi:hypothetical protein